MQQIDDKVALVIREAGKLGTTLSRVRYSLRLPEENEIATALQRLRKMGRVSFDRGSRRWRHA